MSAQEILKQYLTKYKSGSITASERERLYRLIADPQNREIVQEWLAQNWAEGEYPQLLSPQKSEALFNEIMSSASKVTKSSATRKGRLLVGITTAVAAAAIIAIVVSALITLYNPHQKGENLEMPSIAEKSRVDILPPDATRAYITLSTGEILYLDEMNGEEISKECEIELIREDDGVYSYKSRLEKREEIVEIEPIINTLTNPKGSKSVSLLLADGSSVLLNAGSSITYPLNFGAKKREIEISGEALLNVAREKRPFEVTLAGGSQAAEGAKVRVLGTEFNVRSYSDEATASVTLIKGAIEVATAKESESGRFSKVSPSEQATLSADGSIAIDIVDLQKITSWSRDQFFFDESSLDEIAKSLMRWYNVEVNFSTAELKELKFSAIISRGSNVSSILELIELTGAVEYKIEEKRIYLYRKRK